MWDKHLELFPPFHKCKKVWEKVGGVPDDRIKYHKK